MILKSRFKLLTPGLDGLVGLVGLGGVGVTGTGFAGGDQGRGGGGRNGRKADTESVFGSQVTNIFPCIHSLRP